MFTCMARWAGSGCDVLCSVRSGLGWLVSGFVGFGLTVELWLVFSMIFNSWVSRLRVVHGVWVMGWLDISGPVGSL